MEELDNDTGSRAASSTDSSPERERPTRRSVKDLLAELSDSDSESLVKAEATVNSARPASHSRQDESEDSDDDVPVGVGRLAARLAGKQDAGNIARNAGSDVTGGLSNDQVQSDDELDSRPTETSDSVDPVGPFQPRRRLLLKRKRDPNDEGLETSSAETKSSPRGLSVSPTRSRQSSSSQPASSPAPREDELDTSKSKFQQLVEKARKQRLAKEEAEQAKKAARETIQSAPTPHRRGQRGSSPADDSEEDSDDAEVAPAKRLTKDARPTRKASKKALEEMNRETQRMNRNMQLAHQAKTKKKFTKESFFTSFNKSLPMVAEERELPLSSSPSPSSTADIAQRNSTPPTSPLLEADINLTKQPSMQQLETDIDPQEGDDFFDLHAIIAAKDAEALAKQQHIAPVPAAAPTTTVVPAVVTGDSDSDSDIDVVFEKSHHRKYAAFENLPKRKAKETQSHLALRSLAHIKQQMDKKSTMSQAAMGPALLLAARKQAQEERREKIEKLRAAGVIIQTAEDKEQEEEDLENLVERARQEDEEIRKREKELAKRNGTYQKDIDEEDSDDEDEDFIAEGDEGNSGSEEDNNEDDNDIEDEDEDEGIYDEGGQNTLLDEAVEDSDDEISSHGEDHAKDDLVSEDDFAVAKTPMPARKTRKLVVDDEDEDVEDALPSVDSPALPSTSKTPMSVLRSARKVIPGLQHSDDLPIGLTQAFAATMADSQTQTQDLSQAQEQDSMDILRDLPSPQLEIVPRLNRLESMDMISESVAGSQSQTMALDLDYTQNQLIPESPALMQPSQFDLIQDAGYHFSPFAGDRFTETPSKGPHSTEDTVIIPQDAESPLLPRRGRLQRRRQESEVDEGGTTATKSAFQAMQDAAKRKAFRKKTSARHAIDEAAEEEDDEWAGLGGASDDDSGEENEEDRRMIDENVVLGEHDAAEHAQLHAKQAGENDNRQIESLLENVTTGAWRRKRGVGDDLDLSDEDDVRARKRRARQKEEKRLREMILKDEAVGKLASKAKNEAFLRTLEDRENDDMEEEDLEQVETQSGDGSQDQTAQVNEHAAEIKDGVIPTQSKSNALQPARETKLNIPSYDYRRARSAISRKPTDDQLQESLSFLIDEPDSQGIVDDHDDSDEEQNTYVNLDRHIEQAEADENDDDGDNLGDFIVDDDPTTFKKPDLPASSRDRAPFSERRTKDTQVVDRLSLIRQASSSSTGSNTSTNKLAFFSANSRAGSFNNPSSLLRRATTNSSLGSVSGRENVSATGVVTNKTERGSAAQEKEFVRKGSNTARNAINYQGRQNLKEEKMSARAGIVKKQQQQHQKKGKGGGFLSGLFRGDTWA